MDIIRSFTRECTVEWWSEICDWRDSIALQNNTEYIGRCYSNFLENGVSERDINFWMMIRAACERFCRSLNMQLLEFMAQFCQRGANLENCKRYFAQKVKYL